MSVLQVKEPFATTVGGIVRVFAAGDLVPESDPVVKGREHFFESAEGVADERFAARTETTSAAPGTRRVRSTKPKD